MTDTWPAGTPRSPSPASCCSKPIVSTRNISCISETWEIAFHWIIPIVCPNITCQTFVVFVSVLCFCLCVFLDLPSFKKFVGTILSKTANTRTVLDILWLTCRDASFSDRLVYSQWNICKKKNDILTISNAHIYILSYVCDWTCRFASVCRDLWLLLKQFNEHY